VPEIIKHGRLIRPGLGVTIANEQLASRLGIEGLLIINVQPGSAAEKAGLRGTSRSGGEIFLGDIIESINGVGISSYDDLRAELDRHQVGDEVTLMIRRDGHLFQTKLTLEAAG